MMQKPPVHPDEEAYLSDLKTSRRRLAAARGDRPAELVLRGGKVVNLFNGQVEETSLAIQDGLIVGLGDYQGETTLDLTGAYVCPGFIEGHLHVESSLLCPAELARAVCPHGTSTIVADPHEIANVLGLAGVEAMLDNSQGLPVTFYFSAPSCVPSTNMETAGAVLSAPDLARMAQRERVLGLAEVMNFPGVAHGNQSVMAKIAAFACEPVDGHAPGLSGHMLNAYLTAGIESDHECAGLDEAAEKLARGMWIMIRQGTSARNMDSLLPLVNQRTERRCLLVNDDRHPNDLARKGHMDNLLRRAVARGVDPVTALRMVSLNPARRFGLKGQGALAPGWAADLAVVKDLSGFEVTHVFKAGMLVAQDGAMTVPIEAKFPGQAGDSVHLPPLQSDSFKVPLAGPKAHIIGLIPGELITQNLIEEPPQEQGFLAADPGRDIARISVIERHGRSGNIAHGLIKGLGLKEGALASSVAHDSHNLIVAGMDNASMLSAALRVAEMGGGLCVARGGQVLAELPLALAGLMSEHRLERVLADLDGLHGAIGQVCSGGNPFMPLSFTALPVLPSLRITDRGLVDTERFELVELFVK